MESPNVLIVIPSYNEGSSLLSVITCVADLGDILVIDDGSTDNSITALPHYVHLISHNSNLGYCYSISEGLNYALQNDYDVVITMDADGQHSRDSLLCLIADFNYCKEFTGIIIGARSTLPRFYETFISYLTIHLGITRDIFSGLKLYHLSNLKPISFPFQNSFGASYVFSSWMNGHTITDKHIPISSRTYGSSRVGERLTGEFKLLTQSLPLLIFLLFYSLFPVKCRFKCY